MQTTAHLTGRPVKQIKCLGVFGPKYEVGERARQLENGEWMVKIKMSETGETIEYRQSHLDNEAEAN